MEEIEFLDFGIYGKQQKNGPIYDWKNWSKCFDLLDELFTEPKNTSIQTRQLIPFYYERKGKKYFSDKKSTKFKFGSLNWNKKNNELWCTKYRNESNWSFERTEIHYPKFSQCKKNTSFADIILIVECKDYYIDKKRFDQSMFLMLKKGLIEEKLLDEKIREVGQIMGADLIGKGNRKQKVTGNSFLEMQLWSDSDLIEFVDDENIKLKEGIKKLQ